MPNKKNIHFEISERKILLRSMDVFAVLILLFGLGRISELDYILLIFETPVSVLVLGFYILFFGSIFQLYDLQISSNQQKSINAILPTAITTALVYLFTPKLTPFLPTNRIQIFVFAFAILIGLLFWRFIYIKFLANNKFQKKVLLICEPHKAEQIRNEIYHIDPHFHIVSYLDSNFANNEHQTQGLNWISEKSFETAIHNTKFSEIVIAIENTDAISAKLYQSLINYLQEGYIIKEYQQVFEELFERLPVNYFDKDFFKHFPFNRNNQNKLYQTFSRFLDISIAVFGLLFLSLILPFILLGNLIANRGSLFYKQERIGRYGNVFNIYKLRTMVKNAEESGAKFAQRKDHRITPFGNFLRRTRIDEIPQFYNILKNEMALIGPRPERSIFVEQIVKSMPFYETRHIIKPGITGWAQVKYNYGSSLEDSLIKLQYDLYYIKHRNVFLDVNILIKTLSTVLFYKGQ